MEVTMSRSGNNFTLTPRDYGAYASDSYGRNSQSRPRDYGADASNSYGRNSETRPNVPQFVVPSQAASDANWPAPPPWPWWILEDRLVRRSSLLPSGTAMVSPARPLGQGNWQAGEEGSRLTQDEQKKALKKLRKEIYNPIPKRMSTRLCLYYRENAANILKEMEKEKEEDGKSCTICLEDFEPKEMVMMTPCNHMFHEECIVPWVKSHGQCPVCRFALCERSQGSAVPLNNNMADEGNDLFAGELVSIIRAMEQALIWDDRGN